MTAELWQAPSAEHVQIWAVQNDGCLNGRFDNASSGRLEYQIRPGADGCASAKINIPFPVWADRVGVDFWYDVQTVPGSCAQDLTVFFGTVTSDGTVTKIFEEDFQISGLGYRSEADHVEFEVQRPDGDYQWSTTIFVEAKHRACAGEAPLQEPPVGIGPDGLGEVGSPLIVETRSITWHGPLVVEPQGTSVMRTDAGFALRERYVGLSMPPVGDMGQYNGQSQVLLQMPPDHRFNALLHPDGRLIEARVVSPLTFSFEGTQAAFYDRAMQSGGDFDVLLIHVEPLPGPARALLLFPLLVMAIPALYGGTVWNKYRLAGDAGAIRGDLRPGLVASTAGAIALFVGVLVWLIVRRPSSLLYPWPLSPAVATLVVLMLGVVLLIAFAHQTIVRGRARQLDVDLQASRSRSGELESIAYGATHDLKAPLTGLNWLIADLEDQMVKRAPKTAEALRDDIERIRGSVEDMGGLLEDLLGLIRLESDAFPAERVPLSDVIAKVAGGLDGAALVRGGRVEVAGDFPDVQGNPTLLRQLFHNLIDNAIKYGDQQQGPMVKVASEVHPNVVRVLIDDNGPGVPPEHREGVFGLLSKNPDESREIEGTGIGLALVRRIARKHGGDVTIEDSPLGGARFVVTLPAAD